MKSSIYLTGILSLVFILLGSIAKMLHLPLAGILLTLGVILMVALFLPRAYNTLRKATEDILLKAVYLTALIAFSIDLLSALFTIQQWPGAQKLMIIGIPLPFVLFLPTYIYYHNKQKLKANLNFLGVLCFMVFLGVFSSLLAINFSGHIYRSYGNSTSSLIVINEHLSKASGLNLNSKSSQLLNDIETLKTNLVLSIDEGNKNFLPLQSNNKLYHLIGLNKTISYNAELANNLNAVKRSYELFAASIPASDQNNQRLLNEIKTYLSETKHQKGEVITHLPMGIAINTLTDFQNKILLIAYTKADS